MSDTTSDNTPSAPEAAPEAPAAPDAQAAAAPASSEPTEKPSESPSPEPKEETPTAAPKRSPEDLERRLQEVSAENKSYRQRYTAEKEARAALEQEFASERANLVKKQEELSKQVGTLAREKVLAKYEDRLTPDDLSVLSTISDQTALAAAAARFAGLSPEPSGGPIVPSEGRPVAGPTNDMKQMLGTLFPRS